MTSKPIASAHTNYLIGQIIKERRATRGPRGEAALYAPMRLGQHLLKNFFCTATFPGRKSRAMPTIRVLPLSDYQSRDASLANYYRNFIAGWQVSFDIPHPLSVQLHSTLLDQAPGIRGAGG